MINNRHVIGIIPARAGSKGLPGKNVRLLCGKPLLVWTIEKALASKYLDTVLVSTDCENIAAIAKSAGADVPFLRPAHLATDTASSYAVIRHALNYYSPQIFDYTVLLEPTSPLREDNDIDRVISELDTHKELYDSIVTLGAVHEHPSIIKRIINGNIEAFCPNITAAGRRQDLETAYFPYGVAYAAKTDVLLFENTYYTKRCMGYEIKRYQNYEIDDIYDFLCVEAIMKHQWDLP